MRTIMITGAGSGMGRELTRRAIVRGDRTVATVMNAVEAEGLDASAGLTVLEMDVGSNASVETAFAEVDRVLGGQPLDIVINCAGVAPSGALEAEPIDMLERRLNINAVGSARVLRQAMPRLRGHGGRILLFASLWGKVGGPMLSAYCASKHAIEAIVDSVRRETAGQGVDIVLIEPGVVRTNMVSGSVTGSRAGADQLEARDRAVYGPIYDKFAAMLARESFGGVSVEQAADVIEKAAFAAKPRTRYAVGKDAKAVIALARLLPDRALDALFAKMLDRK